MKPVRLEFIRDHVSIRERLLGHTPARAPALLFLLLAGALAGAATVAWQALQTDKELDRARESLRALQGQRGVMAARPTDARRPSLTPQQLQAWSQVARQLNTPWAALLDALEAHTPDDVALVSIEPDPRQNGLRLQAEAKTLDTLLAYAKELDRMAPFDGVRLIKHETNEQDANRPLRLSLEIRLQAAQVKPDSTSGGPR